MDKEFVPYKLAVKLKALGFNEPCFGYYDGNHNLQFMYNGYPEKFSKKMMGVSDSVWAGWISAPTFSQAFRWFREKHSLHVNINPMADSTQHGFIPNGKYSGTIDDITIGKEMVATDTVCLIPVRDTYEEAELACLDKLIEIVESKQRINRIIKDVQDGK